MQMAKAMTKCNECGGMVSPKADVCPHCGIKRNAGKNALKGCISSLFSLVFGLAFMLCGLAFMLWFAWMAIEFLANKEEVLLKELETRCAAAAKETLPNMDRKTFYKNCIAGGRAKLRADGVIK